MAALLERSTSDRLEVATDESGDVIDDNVELVKKSRKSKSQKLAKSQKLSKSKKSKSKKSKKRSKNRNSPNFNTTEAGQSFLTLNTRTAFNCLWLAFIKALIFWHFNSKCHICIETDASSYAMGRVLSQLIFRTSPDGVVTKADLDQ